MNERAKTEAVAELVAEASRAINAAIALGIQGWTTRETRTMLTSAASRLDVTHRAALQAVGMYPAK